MTYPTVTVPTTLSGLEGYAHTAGLQQLTRC